MWKRVEASVPPPKVIATLCEESSLASIQWACSESTYHSKSLMGLTQNNAKIFCNPVQLKHELSAKLLSPVKIGVVRNIAKDSRDAYGAWTLPVLAGTKQGA